jgi:uncharacterized protein YggE
MRALIVCVALLASAAIATAQPAPPTPQDQGPIIVTVGTATVQRPPDVAFVSIGVESRAKGPREAQQQNATVMTAIVDRLGGLSIPANARRTLGLRLEQEYDTPGGRRVLRGYVARNVLEVRVDDLARAGEVADAAVQAGATSIEGIRFDLKDRPAAEREALRLAVADGRARADAAAAGAGRSVDRIIRIEEGERMPAPRPMMTFARATADVATTVVEPGSIDVQARVTLTVVMK